MDRTHSFDAVIEEGRGGGAFVVVPLDVRGLFGTRGQVRVKARFDTVDYRGSLAPMGGRHVLGIRKAIREAIGKSVGDRVRVIIEHDTEERTVAIPPELQKHFRSTPAAEKMYAKLSYTNRRELAEWVASAKKVETRERRAREALARILEA